MVFNFILSSTATTTKTNNDNSQKIKCLCFLLSFFLALKNDLFSFMIDNQWRRMIFLNLLQCSSSSFYFFSNSFDASVPFLFCSCRSLINFWISWAEYCFEPDGADPDGTEPFVICNLVEEVGKLLMSIDKLFKLSTVVRSCCSSLRLSL